MRRLEGKTALITGATTGIGQAIAIRFAQEGASVAINYLHSAADAEETLGLVRETGARAVTIQADVAREADVRRAVDEVIREFGRLDILVNNAGIQTYSPSHEVEMDSFDRILAVNLRGAFVCSREAIRHFLARGGGGVILSTSSVHDIIPKPMYTSYSISKGGVENLTRTLALEYAHHGIRVNAVGPGAVVTPINAAWIDDPRARADVESHIPMGRAAEPSEIASVFAFLASDEASYITGQTLHACGGLTLFPEFRTSWSSGG